MSYNLTKKGSVSAFAMLLSLLLLNGAVFAQDTDYKQNLKSDSEAVAVKAIKTAGNKKDAETLDTLIDILKNNPNPRVRIEAAQAIGKMEVKDKPINALSEAVKTDSDNTVVYASLLSMTNLSKVEKNIQQLPTVLEAVNFCRDNKTGDVYIHDLVTKYDDIISKQKKKK